MKPKIRFKGFEGEWKAEELSHICSVNRGVRVTRNDLHNNGVYPVYQNTDYPMGYYTKFNVESNNPFVIVGGSAGLIGFCHTNFWAADDCVFFGDNPIINKSFLYNNLIFHKTEIKRNVRGASVPRLDRETLRKLPVSIPSLPEQQAIASYFTTLDSQISASTSRLASLKQMKAASLQAMFPQEGGTVPKIRFMGFEGEWKKVKLSEILTERHENSTITDSLPQLSFTIADGVIRPEDRKSNKRDFLIKDIDNKRYLVTKVGDIIYNPANVVYGAIHRNSLMNGVVSPIYKIFTTMQDSNFIECAVRRPSFITKLAMCTEGTVTKLKTLKPEAFLNMEVCITPSLEEQKLIGNYFTSLDRQISLQSQRLEKLKQISND